jgi:hypothetical protein
MKEFFQTEVSGELMARYFSTVLLHCKKKFAVFPSPAGMSLTEPSLAGNNLIIPVLGEFGDIPAGDGKNANLFFKCRRPPWRLSFSQKDRHFSLKISGDRNRVLCPDNFHNIFIKFGRLKSTIYKNSGKKTLHCNVKTVKRQHCPHIRC